MMRKLVGSLVLIAILSAPTMAQEQRRWVFRIGPWFPTSSTVRDATNDLWVYFGVEWLTGQLSSISVDYSEGSGALMGVDHRVQQFAVFANSRQPYGDRLDLIGGLGLVFSRVRVGPSSRSRTRAGATIGVAWRLQPNAELQVRFQSGGGKEVNGFVITLNFRL